MSRIGGGVSILIISISSMFEKNRVLRAAEREELDYRCKCGIETTKYRPAGSAGVGIMYKVSLHTVRLHRKQYKCGYVGREVPWKVY